MRDTAAGSRIVSTGPLRRIPYSEGELGQDQNNQQPLSSDGKARCPTITAKLIELRARDSMGGYGGVHD